MSLDLLSDDIVLIVLELLPRITGHTASLSSLTLCSKRINGLATPLLYRHINPTTWGGEVLLLKTLLKYPKLGTFCKSLAYSRYNWEPITHRSLNDDELALCKERIVTFCDTPKEVERWLADLTTEVWEASISLLLSYMPNVESIEIDQYTDSAKNSFDRLLVHAAMLQSQGLDSPRTLSNLRSLKGSFRTWTGLECLMPFLRLKSLQKVEFNATSDDTILLDEAPTIELESLDLGVVVDGDFSRLEGFLGNFKTLKYFRLHEDDFERDPYNESEPHTLNAAISGLKHCLEELDIDQHPRCPEDSPWISSLADFQRLRKLLVNAPVILKAQHRPGGKDIDVFPASLETLSLQEIDNYVLEQLVEILKRRQHSVSNLVRIDLFIRAIYEEDKAAVSRFAHLIEELRRLCDGAAITLRFIDDSKWYAGCIVHAHTGTTSTERQIVLGDKVLGVSIGCTCYDSGRVVELAGQSALAGELAGGGSSP